MTQHINPGTDTTINPVVIDDSYRERSQQQSHNCLCHNCTCQRDSCPLWEAIRCRKHPSPETCIFGFSPEECHKIDMHSIEHEKAEAARKAREDFAKKIYDMCECVPLKEYASDYDRGFHQAMTLVRGWCTTPQSEQQEKPR